MRVDTPLLNWYDANARILPWRALPGALANESDKDWPYRVWLSEIMLQQTTVATVIPYFAAFIARWPTVASLAAAPDSAVMAAWAGLGYYARARNLLACARAVDGRFPTTETELRKLPGIGQYTAAAIASIAFGKRAVVVDGNVERVVSRLFAVDAPLPAARPELYRLTDSITPPARAGDFAQAMMDLGSAICTSRAPKCPICPLRTICRAVGDDSYPRKSPKASKPDRNGIAHWIEDDDHVWLTRRQGSGLLGGMRGLPGGGWDGSPLPETGRNLGQVVHAFTHFRLTLAVHKVHKSSCALQPDGEWWPLDRIEEAGLPTIFAKAAKLAIRETTNV